MKNQISGVVGLRLGPRRKKALDEFADRRFVIANAIDFH